MNAADLVNALAEALQNAGLGTVGESIFIGRIPMSNVKDGLWSVALTSGSTTDGGTAAQYKDTTQVEVRYHDSDASKMYQNDARVRAALSQLIYTNRQFINITVGVLQDLDLADSEIRVGVWPVTTITFVPGWND